MASQASDLKVRVGFLFDNKSLAGIERDMRRTGQRLSQLGSDMTLAISAPLAAVGVSAIKAAGDLESLTLALKSQLGSAEAASRELELLNEAAKNPGLGLEQAVRGSVRLQGVGLAADEARETLIQMGNAIAATGGTAQELDNVTRQFAQMISKGRVLQEDVSILSENMPGLAQLMQKAFGTQSVEAIRAMGVGGKEFVQRITEAAKELPRVEGGIKNNIGNAIDSLKISAGKLGLALNNAFDISGNLDRLASFVASAADAFSNLSSGTQNLIIGLAGIAVAAGPVLKVYGTLKTTGAEIVNIWRTALVPAAQSLAAGIGNVVTAIRAMNLATQAFLLIGIVTAVAALAYQMGAFNRELTTAEKAQQNVNALMREAESDAAKEGGSVKRLIAVLNDETSSRESKQRALNDLKRINPEYFGQLNIENGKVVGLTESYNAYINSILLAAKAKKAEGQLIILDEQKQKLLSEQVQLQEQLAKLQSQAPVRRGGFGANDGAVLSSSANQQGAIAARITAGQNLIKQIELEEEALNKIAKEGYEQATKAAVKNTTVTKESAGVTEGATKMAEKYRDVIDDITKTVDKAKLFGEDADLAKIDALRNGIEQLIDIGFKPASEEVKKLKEEYDNLVKAFYKPIPIDTIAPLAMPTSIGGGPEEAALPVPPAGVIQAATAALTQYSEAALYAQEIQGKLIDGTFNFSTGLSELTQSLISQGNVLGAVFTAMGDAVTQAALTGETSFASLGQAALGAAAKVVRAFVQQGVAAAVSKALQSLPFPYNIAAGGIAGGVAAALFTRAIGAIGVKGFARGTSYAPGGVALVGEQGPELINLPRGSQVFPTPQTNQMLNGIGQGGVNVSGEFRVQGTDLVLVLERAQQKTNRFR